MINPIESDVGRGVVYTGNYGGPNQDGVITSFNDHGVFVQYKPGCTSQSTLREDLEWLSGSDNPLALNKETTDHE